MSRAVRVALVVALLAVTLAVRLVYAFVAPVGVMDGDATGYDLAAKRLAAGGSFAFPLPYLGRDQRHGGYRLLPGAVTVYESSAANAYTMPGYSFFVSLAYRVSGTGPGRFRAVLVAQAVLATLLGLVLFALARELAGWPAGFAALVAVSAYPPLLWASNFLLTEVLYALLLATGVWLLVVAIRWDDWRAYSSAGIVLGLSCLVRPVAAPWVAFAALLLVAASGEAWRRRLAQGAVLGIAAALVIVPWTLRNYDVYGALVPFTTCSSQPLLAGLAASDGNRLPPDYFPPTGIKDDDLAMGRWWARVAQADMLATLSSAPVSFPARRLQDTAAELARPHAEPNRTPAALDLFARVLQLAALGLAAIAVVLRRRDVRVWLLASLVAYFVVVHALIIPLSRYFFPVMPIAIVLAVVAVTTALRRGAGAPAA